MESVKRYLVDPIRLDNHGTARAQYVVSAADFDRVSAENLALQQRLTVQDQRVDEYEYRLGKVSSVLCSVRFALEGKGKVGWEDRCIGMIDALNPTDEAEDMAIQRELEDNIAFQAAFGNSPADAGGYGDDAPCPECGDRNCNGECMECP
ncbi:hypothetical protein [Pseudomonas sp. Z1-6]|uniref:hypothetical protein n=1 Tax=Pseudomonas sp. Z1-6 TaxID=2817407 RepID=UPI003DA9EA0C